MRFLWCLSLLLVSLPSGIAAQAGGNDPHLDMARRVLRNTPLIDGHNDLPWAIRNFAPAPRAVERYDLGTRTPGHTDLARLRAGMLGGQFWSVYVPGEWADSGYARVQLEQIDIARRIIDRYPELTLVPSTAGLREAHRAGRIGGMLGLEGGHVLENSLGALRTYYTLGARYMTLTHNVTLDWADAASDEARHQGLTRFGEEVVREMNRLGMLVDLSHVSPATMSDALSVTEAPVIFSHSSARALADVVRNVPDSILRRLPSNGGVVMVTFVPSFISQEVADHGTERTRQAHALAEQFPGDSARQRQEMETWVAAHPAPVATLGQVADHIEHIRRVAGVAHVGIGGDFDGITDVIRGLEDVSAYPGLFAELARRGWTEPELRMLAGENILRALDAAEQVAARLQRERPPSMATIESLDRPSTP